MKTLFYQKKILEEVKDLPNGQISKFKRTFNERINKREMFEYHTRNGGTV